MGHLSPFKGSYRDGPLVFSFENIGHVGLEIRSGDSVCLLQPDKLAHPTRRDEGCRFCLNSVWLLILGCGHYHRLLEQELGSGPTCSYAGSSTFSSSGVTRLASPDGLPCHPFKPTTQREEDYDSSPMHEPEGGPVPTAQPFCAIPTPVRSPPSCEHFN